MLTDSAHGKMRTFELDTFESSTPTAPEGVGHTFTVGRNGGAIDALLKQEIGDIFFGEEADNIERLWQKAWLSL